MVEEKNAMDMQNVHLYKFGHSVEITRFTRCDRLNPDFSAYLHCPLYGTVNFPTNRMRKRLEYFTAKNWTKADSFSVRAEADLAERIVWRVDDDEFGFVVERVGQLIRVDLPVGTAAHAGRVRLKESRAKFRESTLQVSKIYGPFTQSIRVAS